jgi:phage shock protein A
MGLTAITRELDAARHNRGATVAVAVFAQGCAPNGCAPLTLHGEHVLCEIDPDDLADNALEAAVRLARALAVAQSRERAGDVDLASIRRQLDALRNHMKSVTAMKAKLTSVANATREVSAGMDTLRQGVIDCVVGIEEEIARPDHCAAEDRPLSGALRSNRVQVGAGNGAS